MTHDIITHQHRGPLPSLYYEGKCHELLALLFQHFDELERAAKSPFTSKDFQRVEEIHRLLSQNPTAELPVENLARLAAMNRTKLRCLFKHAYGLTISQYRTHMQMQWADRMVRDTQMSVAEISYTLGYADASGFIVAYKKFFGRSPGSLRHQQYQ